jgi:NAD+ diphosphatase
MGWLGLRALFGQLDERLFAVAGRAAQLVAWNRDHQFCSRCGSPTQLVAGERARRCPDCGLTAYPRLSPAIIVLIERGDRVLLARGRGMPPNRYGIVAGFVEPGESLEEAVQREVWEEVGLEIEDVRYFASQAWPFPHAIMIGFTAKHAAGEIELRDGELAAANWFSLDALPTVPSKMSIARRLLDAWAARANEVIDQP